MNTLSWVPLFDGRGLLEPYLSWQAHRFLRSHGGIGHILADTPGPWPSLAVTKAAAGTGWHFSGGRVPAKKIIPAPIFVELPVPVGTGDPALAILDKAQAVGPISHLILLRPPTLSLDRIITTLSTLKDSWGATLWIDAASFGWDALGYLCAWDEALLPWRIPAGEFHRLHALAQGLGRTLTIADFSGAPPHPVAPLPDFNQETGAAKALKALPMWSHSR